jgi:hypothetical protein
MNYQQLLKYAKKHNIEYKNNIDNNISYHRIFNRVTQHKNLFI